MRRSLVATSWVVAFALAAGYGCSSSSNHGGGTGGSDAGGGTSSGAGSTGPGCALILTLEDGGPPQSCVWSQDSTCTSDRVSGHCPSADLYGCCVISPMGYTQATCSYGDGGSFFDMASIQNCEEAGSGSAWQTTAP